MGMQSALSEATQCSNPRENEPFVSGGNVLISSHEHHFDIIIIANGVSVDSVIFAVRMNLCLDIVEQAKQPWGMVKLFNEGGFGEP